MSFVLFFHFFCGEFDGELQGSFSCPEWCCNLCKANPAWVGFCPSISSMVSWSILFSDSYVTIACLFFVHYDSLIISDLSTILRPQSSEIIGQYTWSMDHNQANGVSSLPPCPFVWNAAHLGMPTWSWSPTSSHGGFQLLGCPWGLMV